MSIKTILSGPFRGARVDLPWRDGKRKVLGFYEHETHQWWKDHLPSADIFVDVGAGEGFFTYGVCHSILRQGRRARVIAFEPGLEVTGLKNLADAMPYRNASFEFHDKLVGGQESGEMVCLDTICGDLSDDELQRTIVKVDVEGYEAAVMQGGSALLSKGAHWLVEVHGRERIESVQQIFQETGRHFELMEPTPHWLAGAEKRPQWTGWIGSRKTHS